MMKRIEDLFARKSTAVLNIYCTAGFPELDSTLKVMRAIQDNGADIIELGIPYSDPLADGPVIQASGARALENGMTVAKLMEQLKNMRKTIKIPVILMGYMNPVLQYGFERFCKEASEAGVDGLILPDLPLYEFRKEYGRIIKEYDLDFIFLITPETSDKRILELDAESSGFLYAVSSSSTTGGDISVSSNEAYFERLQNLKLKNPVLIGFGIRDAATFSRASQYSAGAIIGTAFINAIKDSDDIDSATASFIRSVKSPSLN